MIKLSYNRGKYMKFKKVLMVCFLATGLLLSACAPANNDSTSKSEEGGEGKTTPTYSEILKECGSEIMQLANPAPAKLAKRSFIPYTNAPAQALAMPGVYLYWSGLLNDIDGVSIVDQAIRFSGTYKFNGNGGAIQQITFDLSVHFDEQNNKFTFLGRQNLPTVPVRYSFLVLECGYNFTSRELSDFVIMMGNPTDSFGNYIRYSTTNGLEVLTFSGNDGHETDPDFIEYNAIATSGVETISTQIQTETVLEGTKLQSAIQAFVSASDYCDEVCEGVNFDVEVVSE